MITESSLSNSPGEFKLKNGMNLSVLIFLLFLPFFRFTGISNFKAVLAIVFFALFLTNNLIKIKDFKPVRLHGFLLFFAWCIICLPFARDITNSLEWIFDFFCYYLFYVLITKTVKTKQDIDKVDNILICFLAVEMVFAVGQLLNISALAYYSEAQRGESSFFSEEGGRFWGTFMNSLSLASFVSAIGIYLFSKFMQTKSLFKAYSVLGVTLFLILLSGTRSGAVSFIVVFTIFLLQNKKQIYNYIFYVFLFILGIYFTFGFGFILKSTLFERSVEGNDGRLLIWYNTIPIFIERPLIGTTMGNLSSYMLEQPLLKGILDINAGSKTGHVENIYFTLLLSVGVFGLIFIFYQIYLLCKRVVDLSDSLPISNAKVTVSSLGLALISISISMLFEPSYLTVQNSVLLLFLFLGLLYSTYIRFSFHIAKRIP